MLKYLGVRNYDNIITHYTIDKFINNGVFLFYAENLLLAQGINKNVNRTWNNGATIVASICRESLLMFLYAPIILR